MLAREALCYLSHFTKNLGMEGEGIKENDGGGEVSYDIL
jgi:hypothetical protein